MPETTTSTLRPEWFDVGGSANWATYAAGDGSYFDVLDALPDGPPGSVLVNVSGVLFGLAADDLNVLLCMLGPEAVHGQAVLQLKDPDGQVWLTAESGPDGLMLTVSFPACGMNGRVILPHDQDATVRAAVEEAAHGE